MILPWLRPASRSACAPARAALLVDLILAGPEVGFPEPGSDPRAVATAWLTSLAAGLNDQATRAAVLAVTARADVDPDSAQSLQRISADRLAAFNQLLAPSGHGPGVRTARRAGLRPAFLRPGRGHQRVHRHGGDRVVADPRPPLRSLRTRWGLGRGETSWGGWIWLIAGGSQAW